MKLTDVYGVYKKARNASWQALIDNKVVGILHFKQLGDLIDCYHILVEGKYQKLGIGSALLGCVIKEAQ